VTGERSAGVASSSSSASLSNNEAASNDTGAAHGSSRTTGYERPGVPAKSEGDDEDDDIGPKLPSHLASASAAAGHEGAVDSEHGDGLSSSDASLALAARSLAAGGCYGGGLRPGEGQAIAAFVESGQRVPRRGEVGWNSNEIERLESAGYVMSGSRHKRMNEVRLRKESQVYTAQEKKALALFSYEQKQEREKRLMEEFRAMVGSANSGSSSNGGAGASGTAGGAGAS
jgi:NF-kappa-B-activating protein C-terminal domain